MTEKRMKEIVEEALVEVPQGQKLTLRTVMRKGNASELEYNTWVIGLWYDFDKGIKFQVYGAEGGSEDAIKEKIVSKIGLCFFEASLSRLVVVRYCNSDYK